VPGGLEVGTGEWRSPSGVAEDRNMVMQGTGGNPGRWRSPSGRPRIATQEDVPDHLEKLGRHRLKNAVVEHGARLGINVEVVNRNPGVRGFHVVKRRWVVERSLGWIMMRRRPARDYETLAASS